MIDLYIVRHGQTEWNVQKRMQGRLDSSLTEKGIKNALRLRDRLAPITFDEVYSSPSERALTTARLIQPDGKKITIDSRLMEIHLGKWQGKTEQEIQEQFPVEYDHYWNAPELFRNEDGETFTNVKERIEDFLSFLEEKHTNGKVLIVTHGVAIMTFLMITKKIDLKDFWADPLIEGTSLSLIRLENGEKNLLVEGCKNHLILESVK